MIPAVLADTGPLYALADPSDQHHKRAAHELGLIDKNRLMIAVAYPVLCEAQVLILRRLGGKYPRQWMAEIVDGAPLLNPEPADYQSAFDRINKFADHPITLVDAVIAAMSERLELPVWSFDRHFVTMAADTWRRHD
jgi:uncharacterized protein